MSKNVFISKNKSEIIPFIEGFQQKGFDLIAHSFLSFKTIEFEIKQSYEIIFFSSPRSVIFYKSQYSIPENVQVTCIGDKTKELLIEMGHTVSFSRKENESLLDFATSLREWSGGKRILFPVSTISLKTISSIFPKKQIEEVEVYSTKILGKEIEDCEVYVFTSPSNVEGFLKENSFPKSAKIISWGESTSIFILKNGGRVDVELKKSSLQELKSVL